ncbi:MAG: hypothetical protein ACM3TR_10930 [Caulobacteraceae bacterium]
MGEAEKAIFSIVLQSENQALNEAYEAYLSAKEKLQRCLYEEGIVLHVEKG